MRAAIPTVTIAPGLAGSYVPEISIAEAVERELDSSQVRAGASALAQRMRPDNIKNLPISVELTVIADERAEIFHFRLDKSEVFLTAEECPDARVKVTLQRGVDLALMENGIPLIVIIASGRASIIGSLEDILGVFGDAYYPTADGRRSFFELSRMLMHAKSAKPREVGKILDDFGRADFAKELAHFFADAALLSGLTKRLPIATIRLTIGSTSHILHVSAQELRVSEDDQDVRCDASIDVPKMETAVDRLLGRIGDMDAILSRKMLVAGSGIDDLMPLFERISTGLSVFTTSVTKSDWTFPSTPSR